MVIDVKVMTDILHLIWIYQLQNEIGATNNAGIRNIEELMDKLRK